MSWAYGELNGREVGYGIEATCDEPGCNVRIDRGLDYRCGFHFKSDIDSGCGRYFCYNHLSAGPCPHDTMWNED